MRLKTVIGLFLAVTGLFTAYFFLEYQEKTREQRNQLLPWPEDEVTVLSFMWALASAQSGDHYTLKRRQPHETRQWQMTQPRPLPADPIAIGVFLKTLHQTPLPPPLEGTEAQSDNAYGLRDVKQWLRFSNARGDTLTLKIGDEHPISGKRYLQIQGRPQIYTIDTAVFDRLQAGEPRHADVHQDEIG